MKWRKKGFICDCNSFNLSWYKKNSMVPVPYFLDENTIRIFLTMCDQQNIGRIGYVDVEAKNPLKIKGYSKEPLIDIGFEGTFDDNGVVTASVLKDDDKLYMYYSGYQLGVKTPYSIFTGVAVSVDNGHNFIKLTNEVPILDRISGEIATRCVPYVIKEGSIYKMWYTASVASGWINSSLGKRQPLYDLKYMESDSPIKWQSEGRKTVITFKNSDEHGICKSSVWKENGLYKIIYSLRHLSKGYRLGYAESLNGIDWIRKDEDIGLTVSQKGFDSNMVCFAERIVYKDKTCLFYSGNHYGMAGIGYAELEKK